MINDITLQLLQQSYWMHFKEAKDLALYFTQDHPKVVLFTKTIEDLRLQIEKLKSS